MSRTAEELRSEWLRHGPWWMQDPEEVLDAVARIVAVQMERVEGAIETLHDRTFILRADGAWLDEHGSERLVPRRSGENDTAYAPRIRTFRDRVTAPAIVAAVDEVLLVGSCRLDEHQADAAFACAGGVGSVGAFACDSDDVAGIAYVGSRELTVYIPLQLPETNDTAWSIASGGPGSTSPESFATPATGGGGTWPASDAGSYADEPSLIPSEVYRRVWETIDENRAGGIAFRVVVE